MKIFLTGFMGSGKTTYGKALAEAMGYKFIDLDGEIEAKEKASVQAIFEEKGEEHFRKVEHEALMNTEKETDCVIATGGGTPCFNEQMQWMNKQGLTVYLKLFEGQLSQRLEPELETRPLLKGLTVDELDFFIYKNLRLRAFYYHQAKILIDPIQVVPEDLADIVRANY